VQTSIIKKNKPKSPTSQRNSEIISLLIRDKGENQLKFKLLKLQVKDKKGEFKFKLGFGDDLLPKLKRKNILSKFKIQMKILRIYLLMNRYDEATIFRDKDENPSKFVVLNQLRLGF